jgi:flagellar biosynthesis/type III secretory pathway chaperone
MNGDTQQRIESVLDREIAAARSLAATLEAERAALTGPSTAAVTAAAAQKVELFSVIEQLEIQRRDLCATANVSFPSLRDGRLPVVAGLLLEVVSACRIANEVNGYIINARRGQVSQLLQILRGGAPVVYGPQGMTQTRSLRALARA